MTQKAISREAAKAIITPAGYVEYNGYVFNELIKTKLEITPVMNHARTGPKYVEMVFTIEGFISPDDIRAARISPTNNGVKYDYENTDKFYSPRTYMEPPGTFSSPAKNRTGSNDSTDSNFRLMRSALLSPGGRFIYGNKGAGEDLFFSNAQEDNSSRVKDICFGPMPKLLSFEPIAGNKSARIIFQVLVRTVQCAQILTSEDSNRNIVDLSLTTNIKTNASGYKQIHRKGYLEIGMARETTGVAAYLDGDSDNFIDNAAANVYSNVKRIEEAYKEVLNNLIGLNMQGYKVSHEIDFAPDHRSCTFSIFYNEIESPNAYPNGVVKISASHSTRSSLLGDEGKMSAGNYSKWLNTMSASITLRPNIPPIKAWFIFTEILNERLSYDVSQERDFWGTLRTKIPMVLEIELEESIFSHEYNFKVVWVSWLDNINELFDKTGMFQPIQSTNWFDWTVDTRVAVNSVDGAYPLVPGKHGGDYFNQTLCNRKPSTDLHYTLNLETTRGYPPEFIYSLFGTNCPPEDTSWIDYQQKYYVVSSVGRTTYQRYDTEQTKASRASIPVSDSPMKNTTFEMADYYVDSEPEEYYTQDFGKDKFKVVVRGYAIRLGHPTTPPLLTELGGRQLELIPDADITSNHPRSTAGNCPIIVTTWERHYRILGKPKGDMSRSNKDQGKPQEFQ